MTDEADVPQYGPARIVVEVWMDKDPEVEAPGLADWLVRDALRRAAFLMDPDQIPIELMSEDEYEDDEGETT